jgi:trehalose/maltose transport system substrate-binding protein
MRILLRSLILLVTTLGLVALSFLQHPWNVQLTVTCGSGALYKACSKAAKTFAEESGYTLRVQEAPGDLTLHLNYVQALVDSDSAAVDVYLLESTWVGTLSDGLLPLPVPQQDTFFAPSLDNNRVGNTLRALPFTLDLGVLYVREDLLSKYNYKLPTSWQDLTDTATAIALKEKMKLYLFPSDANNYTAQAVEWFTSEGAGTMVEASKYITVQNVPALRTVSSSWFAKLSVPAFNAHTLGETEALTEIDALAQWQAGEAVFMRHWLQASMQQDLRGIVAALPAGEGGSHGVLGGWQLGVNKNSKHMKEALEFLAFMTRHDTQKHLAEQGFLPVHATLYLDRELQQRYPIFAKLPVMFENAVFRPSSVTNKHYWQVSKVIRDILTSERPPQQKIQDLADGLSAVKRGTW